MSHHSFEKQTGLDDLVFEYEVASQKGAVPFFEETVFCALADYFEKIRQLGKAQSILTDGLTQHPLSSELYLRRAELLLQNSQLDEARHWLEKAANILPDHYMATLARAEAFCCHGNGPSAMAMLREIRQRPTPKPRVSDEILGHLKGISQKFRRLKEVLLDEPGNENALKELGFCVEISGQFAQSVALHERLIDMYPYNSRAWFNLGTAWENLDKVEDALEAYEYAYLINPDFREAYEAFSQLAFGKGHFKLAIRACDELARRLGHDSETFVMMGKCQDSLGNHVKARQDFHRATILDETFSEAHFLLGQCEVREGRFEHALQNFATAIYWDDETDEYQLAIAQAYAATGQSLKAVLHFRKSLVLCCGAPKFWLRFAEFFAKNGQWKKALWVVDDGILNSYGPELGYYRAAALFQTGRRAAGFDQLEATLTTDFDAHTNLFGFNAGLLEDIEVRAFIDGFQNTAN